ncbi:unnamed protein product [Parajaminaea phylloscopi]
MEAKSAPPAPLAEPSPSEAVVVEAELPSHATDSRGDGPAHLPTNAEPQPAHNLYRAQQALQGGIFVPPTEHPPLRLANIRLVGSTNVRPGFLQKLCGPYLSQASPLQRLLHSDSARMHFSDPDTPKTLREIVTLSASLADDLQRLDLFKEIDVSFMPTPIDDLAPSGSRIPSALEDVDVVMQLRENPRFWLKSSSDVGNGEGSVSLQGRIRNLFGGGERLEGSYEVGTRTKTALQLNLTAPIEASPDHAFGLSIFSTERDKSYYASHYESLTGLKASVSTANGRRGVTHDLSWECVWRRLGRLGANASMSIRKARGDDVKSALVHSFQRDTRDLSFLGTEGSLVKSTTELASGWLGGERDHLRWEGEASISRSLASTWLSSRRSWPAWLQSEAAGFSFGGRAGLITSLPRPDSPLNGGLHTSDLFQLGGPTSLRMFAANSLGPKDGPDSLGGTAFWSLGTSLYAPIPKKEHWPLKIHTFFNAGQLAAPPSSLGPESSPSTSQWKRDLQDAAKDVLLRPSSSAGVGLLYTQGPLRLELNAGMPLTAVRGDGVRKGLQVGIGIDFLGG